MRLFLCSNFSKSGKLIQDEVEGKNLLFIPTASIEEEYKGYVNSARQLWQEMNVNVIDLELSAASSDQIEKAFKKADIVYFTSGNTFVLLDQIKKLGVDELIKKHLKDGKLYVGESAGAIICAKELYYIEPLYHIPENYSQIGYSGLGLIDFYILPHDSHPLFKKITNDILEKFPTLDICSLTNSQAVLVENGTRKLMSI